MNNKKTSEFALIEIIKNKSSQSKANIYKGIGDDAGVIKDADKYYLYTCDAQVENVHFLRQAITPFTLGQKAIAVNLSDIAAMGARPTQCLISLFLPGYISEKYISELYDGINDECQKYGVQVIGGNIAKSTEFIIDVFMIGMMSKKPILRSGAKVGDLVLVSGKLGASRVPPIPRVEVGIMLGESCKVHAMIDLSDGLSSDIGHLCEESKVGVQIFADKLPTDAGIEQALNRGEDYELCFTVSPDKAEPFKSKIKKETGVDINVIGEILPQSSGRILIDQKGQKTPLKAQGWDHFIKE